MGEWVKGIAEDEREELMRALEPMDEMDVSAEWREEVLRRGREID